MSLACPSRRLAEHSAENAYEVVQSPQVAIFPVPLRPGRSVVQRLRVRQGNGLPKVNHPHFGLAWGVVHKQQRAADNLCETSQTREVRDARDQVQKLMRGHKAITTGTTGLFENCKHWLHLTSCALKNWDCSRAERSSSNLWRYNFWKTGDAGNENVKQRVIKWKQNLLRRINSKRFRLKLCIFESQMCFFVFELNTWCISQHHFK